MAEWVVRADAACPACGTALDYVHTVANAVERQDVFTCAACGQVAVESFGVVELAADDTAYESRGLRAVDGERARALLDFRRPDPPRTRAERRDARRRRSRTA